MVDSAAFAAMSWPIVAVLRVIAVLTTISDEPL
jgi:hypothetical protein